MLEALQFDFMRNALWAVILLSLSLGIIGTICVINKMTFIAGGIAHGAYGGIGIAVFLGLSPLFGASVFAVILGLIIAFLSLKNKERIDSVIGAIWAFGMAVGIVFTDLSNSYNPDLMSYLFGSILAINETDLFLMAGLDAVILAFVAVFYPQICALCYDSQFAKIRGLKTQALYYANVALIALCVVISIRVVGLILVVAMLSIPPFIAEKFSKNLKTMMAAAAGICLICGILGLNLSFKFNLTSGASIILVAIAAFFVAIGAEKLFKFIKFKG